MLALPALSLDFHRRRVPGYSKIRSPEYPVQIAQLSRHARDGIVHSWLAITQQKASNKPTQSGNVPAVWSPVLVLAFMLALDPLRLGLLLLVVTRPRPVQSILVYWVGAMTASVLYMLVPLMVLHVTPGFRSVAQHLASQAIFGSPTVRHIQFGMGVVALLIAARMAVRLRAGQRAYVATPADTPSPLVAESNTPIAISQPLDRAPDAPTEGGSPILRLFARARGAWHRLWVPPWVRGNPNLEGRIDRRPPRGRHL